MRILDSAGNWRTHTQSLKGLSSFCFLILKPAIYIQLTNILVGTILLLFQTNNLFFYCNSIAYIEFKTEAEAEKMLEEAQGADVQGRSIMVDYVGEKSQKGAKVAGKPFLTFL